MDSKRTALFGILAVAGFLLGLGLAFSFKLLFLLLFAIIFITLLLMGRTGLEISFLALVFILPFQYFIPANIIAPVNFSLLEQLSRFSSYLRLFLFVSTALLLVISIIRKETRIEAKINPVILVLVSFFVMEFLSNILVGGEGFGGTAFVQLFDQLWPFLVFITTYYICSDIKMIKRAISVFMLTAPIVIGLGYLEKIFNTIIFTPKTGLVASGGIQVASTFWDPNQLGRYLIILIILALPFFVYEKKINIWNILLSSAALILLLFTGSTSDLVCLFIALAIFAVFSKYFRSPSEGTHENKRSSLFQAIKYSAFGAAAVFSAAGIYFSFKDYLIFTFNKLFSFQTSARFNLDLAGLAMFVSSPFYGIGFAHFQILYSKFNPMLNIWGFGQEMISHNSLIKVASEMGVIGLLPLFYIYYYFIKITLIAGRAVKSDYLRRLQLALGAIWIAMIVNSWGYWRFFEDPRIWFAVGLALATNNLRGDIQSDEIYSR
jgi:hypothetical protein